MCDILFCIFCICLRQWIMKNMLTPSEHETRIMMRFSRFRIKLQSSDWVFLNLHMFTILWIYFLINLKKDSSGLPLCKHDKKYHHSCRQIAPPQNPLPSSSFSGALAPLLLQSSVVSPCLTGSQENDISLTSFRGIISNPVIQLEWCLSCWQQRELEACSTLAKHVVVRQHTQWLDAQYKRLKTGA